MDLCDVEFLGILNSQNNILYAINAGKLDSKVITKAIDHTTEPISMYEDKVLLHYRQNGTSLVLLGVAGANEIFLQESFDSLIEVLNTKVLKRWSAERVVEKYDQVVILFNEYVFRGVILSDSASELSKKTPKRSFEHINGIKVKKGLASFLNKAAKSITRQ